MLRTGTQRHHVGQVRHRERERDTDKTVLAWGNNSYSQTDVPADLTNATAVSAGSHSVALREDGTVVVWGAGSREQRLVPPGLGMSSQSRQFSRPGAAERRFGGELGQVLG